MNNTFSLEQIWRTGTLDANLIPRQHKLGLMAKFMEIKSTNPRLRQVDIAKELGYSGSSLLRSRQELNMISTNRSSIKIHKKQKITNKDSDDVKRRQLIPKDPTENDKHVIEKVNAKNSLGDGDPNGDNHTQGRDPIEQAFSCN